MASLTIASLSSCKASDKSNSTADMPAVSATETNTSSVNEITEGSAMIISINGIDFSATCANTLAAKALASMLPLTLDMADLHSNEKYAYLDRALPRGTDKPDRMEVGQIMLYGSDCLVLFYEGFANSYGGYSAIATVDDPSALTKAVGSGSVTVTFSEG